MEFEIGDRVVYPNQGVGIIESVFKSSVGGQVEHFYRLRLESNGSRVMVPVNNAENIGVRRLCGEIELKKLFEILDGEPVEQARDWKDRYKDNVEKMMGGSILDVAEVLKGLSILGFQKPLSFREKKMYDRARKLIVSEIATVRERELDDVDEQVERMLREACEQPVA